jgi:hypothetical protein
MYINSVLVIGKFPTNGVFLRAAKRKFEANFHNFFDVVNLNEIFYVMKLSEKSIWVFLLLVG